ncbi:hypothetical protein [Nocardioides zeae]
MESNDVRAQLHDLERAEAAPYVDQRPSPGGSPRRSRCGSA